MYDETVPLLSEECGVKIAKGLHEQEPGILNCIIRFAPMLRIHLRRRFMYCLSDEELDNIIMDAMVRVFVKGRNFDPKRSKFSTWLYQHTIYGARTFLQSRLNEVSLDGITENRWNVIEQVVETPAEVSSEMEKVLRRLPERQAEIIRLYYFEKWLIEEIAGLFGYRVSTVRSVLSRARQNIRKFVGGNGR